MASELIDSFGRKIDNLRISVTDRCNFRCRYCMPEEGMTWMEHREILTYEEIVKIVGILVPMGVRKVRLTGGEPLMRKELPKLVAGLGTLAAPAGTSDSAGLRDIALTTNGYFLREQARDLARAGLRRINVSLDSLDRATFEKMVRRDYLGRVLEGIEAAIGAGLGPVKINAVLIRGINDGELETFAKLARDGPLIVRFIEFMPIGAEDGWSNDRVVTTAEVLERLAALGYPTMPVGRSDGQPADRYRFADGKGEIGFISSVSTPFCSSCNRIRLTSDGKLRTCLFSTVETDLKGPLRAGAGAEEIRGLVLAAVAGKEEGHLINQPGFVRPDRTMSSIGG
jgi:cyclic pyranopterin phosphate synthase